MIIICNQKILILIRCRVEYSVTLTVIGPTFLIVTEITGQARNRVYRADEILAVVARDW